jgi:NTP pyrophosphatase (non-canonical NTP hydrolase)
VTDTPSTIQGIIDQCQADSERWFPDLADNLFFQVACAAGEAGEMINEAKKYFRSVDARTQMRMDKIEEEAIDVLIYLCCVFGILGTDVVGRYNAKRADNEKRFGTGAFRS